MLIFRIYVIVALAAVPFILMLQNTRRRHPITGGPVPAFNSILERLCYAAMLVGLAIVAITGLVSAVFIGRLSSYMLMLHVSGAPLFAIALTALAILWADRHTLASFYYRRLPFWLMLFFGMLVILTGVLPMTVFSAHEQGALITTHMYCGVLVLVFAVIHFVRIRQRA